MSDLLRFIPCQILNNIGEIHEKLENNYRASTSPNFYAIKKQITFPEWATAKR